MYVLWDYIYTQELWLSTVYCKLFCLSYAWTSKAKNAEVILGYDVMMILNIDLIPLTLLYMMMMPQQQLQ